jgi:hypothetical protein
MYNIYLQAANKLRMGLMALGLMALGHYYHCLRNVEFRRRGTDASHWG